MRKVDSFCGTEADTARRLLWYRKLALALWMGLNTGSNFSPKQLSDRDLSFNPYALYSNNSTPRNLS